MLAVLAVALAGCGGGGAGTPPADDAARLVPADALVYVHVSTDTGRAATKRAEVMAERFPGFAAARRALVQRLSAPRCGIDVGRLRGGREAALALLDTGGGTAGSLVLVDLGKAGRRPERTCGAVQVAQLGRFLVIGQPQTLQLARRLAQGRGRSLAGAPDYRRATGDLPPGRVLDAWATRAGVRRLLAPQGGLLGAAGLLLDQPALKGAAIGLTAEDGRARLTVKSILSRRPRSAFPAFEPTLDKAVPRDVLAYLGVSGLSGAATRLLTAIGPQAGRLAPLLRNGTGDLAPLLALFRGEVAVTLTRAVPAPILTLIARTSDARAARATLRRMPAALRRVFRTAVVDGKVVLSTRAAGIRAVRAARGDVTERPEWDKAVPAGPKRVSSLVFLDFNQLLRLGEQTGLNDSRAYLAVRRDLQRVRAVGARSSSAGDESTAEILLTIP